MKNSGYIPKAMYALLLQKAHEMDISAERLKFDLLRFAMEEKLGFKCSHQEAHRKWARNVKQFYCADCFTLFQKISMRSGEKWVPEKPFWEIKKEMTAQEWAKMIKPENGDLK